MTQQHSYDPVIARFSSLKILVLGDMMLDHFLWGRVERISPEAPVPVVDVERESFHAGGAGNVVMNLRSLGIEAVPVSIVGDDAPGFQIRQILQQQGVDHSHILKCPRPTTVKTRIVAHQQQVVRVDREDRSYLDASTETSLANLFLEKLPSVDGVIISDYSKGCISSTLLAKILPAAREKNKLVCVDPKPRHFRSYTPVSFITPNQSEAASVLGYPIASEEDLREAGRRILELVDCRGLLITRGEKGMALFSEGKMTLVPTKAREVYDVTGAGDTVISVLCASLAAGADVLDAVHLANEAAGIVVGKVGTASVTPEELSASLR